MHHLRVVIIQSWQRHDRECFRVSRHLACSVHICLLRCKEMCSKGKNTMITIKGEIILYHIISIYTRMLDISLLYEWIQIKWIHSFFFAAWTIFTVCCRCRFKLNRNNYEWNITIIFGLSHLCHLIINIKVVFQPN